jgi:hypothetical protein
VVRTDTVTRDSHGYDAGEKINGCKRFIVTDTLGLLIVVVVPGRARFLREFYACLTPASGCLVRVGRRRCRARTGRCIRWSSRRWWPNIAAGMGRCTRRGPPADQPPANASAGPTADNSTFSNTFSERVAHLHIGGSTAMALGVSDVAVPLGVLRRVARSGRLVEPD